MLFYFSQLITFEASTICPTCILSWLSFTILNLPLPICWIWARNTLSEPWTIHHIGTPSLDCPCCFLPYKILSAVAQATYCLLIIIIFVLRSWIMGVRSIGTTYVITVPNDSILLYISEIELTASTFVFYRHFRGIQEVQYSSCWRITVINFKFIRVRRNAGQIWPKNYTQQIALHSANNVCNVRSVINHKVTPILWKELLL